MIESSWEKLKLRSQYHFDNDVIDPKYDTVTRIGLLSTTWTDEQIAELVTESKEVTWRTRGSNDKDSKKRSEEELLQEEYDLEAQGYGKDHIVTNLNWEVPANLLSIAKNFQLDGMMARLHVQHPGQAWNLHLDKLEKWFPEDPSKVERYMIQLTDWQPGQFWSYGNYNYCQWKAGDVTTFDWKNVPHSTANASHYPRVTLQVTGISTPKTDYFLDSLKKEV
tara:strand:- start:235 stop:900 length:666 start_codon:yes stop_codon:yes gene_type:complete